MTFYAFCKAMSKYDFILSDIIMDYQYICREQKSLGNKRPKFNEEHLIEWGAQVKVLQVFRDYKKLYESYKEKPE